MFWLDFAYKIIKVFKDGATPSQIAWGLVIGFLMGFTPGWPVQVFAFLLIALVFNINLTMVILGTAISSLLARLLDPLFDSIGYAILTGDSLKSFFTILYNHPAGGLTRFNNTVVMGGFISGVVLIIPLFLLFRWFVIYVRKHLIERFSQTKFAKFIKKSWIYGVYSKINAVGSRL